MCLFMVSFVKNLIHFLQAVLFKAVFFSRTLLPIDSLYSGGFCDVPPFSFVLILPSTLHRHNGMVISCWSMFKLDRLYQLRVIELWRLSKAYFPFGFPDSYHHALMMDSWDKLSFVIIVRYCHLIKIRIRFAWWHHVRDSHVMFRVIG